MQNHQTTEAWRKVANRVTSCHGERTEDRIQLYGRAPGTNDKSGRHVAFMDICQGVSEKTSGYETSNRFTPFRRSAFFFRACSAASTEWSEMVVQMISSFDFFLCVS